MVERIQGRYLNGTPQQAFADIAELRHLRINRQEKAGLIVIQLEAVFASRKILARKRRTSPKSQIDGSKSRL